MTGIKSALFVTLILLFSSLSHGAMRGRPIIVDGHLRAENGTPLRMAAFLADVFFDIPDMQANESLFRDYFTTVSVTYHMNGVRITPWMGQYDVDVDDPTNQARLIYFIDKLVDWAEEDGIYAVVNNHTQYNTTINYTVWQKFWNIFGDRYKDKTHVIYEITNEPEPTSADTHMTNMYNYVRAMAPNTHIIVWSFADAYDLNTTLLGNHSGINYSNASVGYHVYYELGTGRWDHMETIKNTGPYPIIATEFHSLTNANDLPIDYQYLMTNIKNAEAKNESWMQWAPQATYRTVSKDPDWEEGNRFSPTYLSQLDAYGITFWPADNQTSMLSFPSIPISDNFNRANQNPIESPWVNSIYPGVSTCGIGSNRLIRTGAAVSNSCYLTPSSMGTDKEFYVTLPIASSQTSTSEFRIMICLVGGVGTNSVDGYSVEVGKVDGSADYLVVSRFDNTGFTEVSSRFSQEVTDGNRVGAEWKTDGTINVWYDGGSGWTQLFSHNDTTYDCSTSHAGTFIYQNSMTMALDDFAFGNKIGGGGGGGGGSGGGSLFFQTQEFR